MAQRKATSDIKRSNNGKVDLNSEEARKRGWSNLKPLQPGQSGNPSGRPVMPEDVKEALRAASLPAAQRLAQLIHSDDERIALMASETVLARLYGKPTQAIDANVKTESIAILHLQALQDIAARREARLAGVVDVTPRVEEGDTDKAIEYDPEKLNK